MKHIQFEVGLQLLPFVFALVRVLPLSHTAHTAYDCLLSLQHLPKTVN